MDWSAHRSPGSTAGRLLVASPLIGDPNFERTVVLMIEHTEEGALGVVLNRPSGATVAEALPPWTDLAADPGVVFVGGPVSPDAVLGLGAAGPEAEHEGWTPVLGSIGTVDLNQDPSTLATQVREVRLFAGYAGWGDGQLEGELAAGAWFVLDAEPDDVLTRDPDELWSAVLARQPGELGWFANYPLEPRLN